MYVALLKGLKLNILQSGNVFILLFTNGPFPIWLTTQTANAYFVNFDKPVIFNPVEFVDTFLSMNPSLVMIIKYPWKFPFNVSTGGASHSIFTEVEDRANADKFFGDDSGTKILKQKFRVYKMVKI